MFPYAFMANLGPRVASIVTGEGDGFTDAVLDVSSLGLAENDVLVVFLGHTQDADLTFAMSGFTAVADLYANDSYDANLHVGYKVQTSSPDSSVTLIGATSISQSWSAVAFNVRGLDTGTVLDVSAQTATAINTLLIDPPTVTPTSGKVIILSGGSTASNDSSGSWTSADLSDLTVITGTSGSSLTNVVTAAGWVVHDDSAFNPAAFSPSFSDRTDACFCACTIALRTL